MVHINNALEGDPALLSGCSLVYDAEALFTDREVAKRTLRGDVVLEEERQQLICSEAQIARFASTIICVSLQDAKQFARWFDKDIRVLGHTIQSQPCTNSFEERRDILFVGAIHGDDSPNADSLIWFIDEVLPLLRREIASPFKFIIAGMNSSPAVERRLGGDVFATGRLGDLSPLYAGTRIFVAPTRFAAGIPHKVHEAAGSGLPCVVTPHLLDQLGWTSGKEVLVGEDARAFAQACARLYADKLAWTTIRDNAIEAVKRDCDPLKFIAALSSLHATLAEGRVPAVNRRGSTAQIEDAPKRLSTGKIRPGSLKIGLDTMRLDEITGFADEFDLYLAEEIDNLQKLVEADPSRDRSALVYKSVHRLRYSLTMREIIPHIKTSDEVLETAGYSTVSRFLMNNGMLIAETEGDLRYGIADLGSQSKDVVFSFEVIEHIKDQDGDDGLDLFNLSGVFTYVSEMFRILRPGGIVVVTTPNACSTNLLGHIIAMQPAFMYRPHVREYAPGEIFELFQQRQGFITKSLKTFDSYPARPERSVCEAFLGSIAADVSLRGDTLFAIFQRPTSVS
jgi:hypothetical protein